MNTIVSSNTLAGSAVPVMGLKKYWVWYLMVAIVAALHWLFFN